MIEKINIPTVFIIRGGSGSGKTTLSEKIGESYGSWGYYNLNTREELERLGCVVISCDAIFNGLFGHPVDLARLDQYDNNQIFYDELLEEIEVCLSKFPMSVVIEGITCYRYLDRILKLLSNRATVLSFEMVETRAYPDGRCLYADNLEMKENNLYPYSETIKMLKEIIIGRERPSMYENAYQYFPELKYQKTYSSNSPEKFKCLNIPEIRGKRVLDVGCNLGYFVFQYRKMGAKADGLDVDRDFIVKASKFKNIMYSLDDINFYCGDIFKYNEKKYDVITMLSAFHYFREKQKNLLEKIHSLLNKDGILVLEIGLTPDKPNEVYIEKYSREIVDIEPCYFPNEMALTHMISGLFEISYSGDSVQQSGDRLPRKVFHLKKV